MSESELQKVTDAILKANPVLKTDGFEAKSRRWNALLAQARALGLSPEQQIEFIKKAQQP